MMPLALWLLLAAHLFGDFCLQNHWMQAKSRDSVVCTVHVLVYSLGFWALLAANILPGWMMLAILVQHWFQDRFALHLKWMRFYRQTDPSIWSVGPLCMDQAWHIAFIGAVVLLQLITGHSSLVTSP